MNQKVLGSLFVLAVALGTIGVAVRKTTPPMDKRSPEARKSAEGPASPALARPLACYRVREQEFENGMDYKGVGYSARVSEQEVRFGPSAGAVHFGAPRVEQGSAAIDCVRSKVTKDKFGIAKLECGPLVEEYVFENRRVEQLFRIAEPIASGDLRLRIPVTSDLGGPIETHKPASGNFEALEFKNGGVAFLDLRGNVGVAYHSAVVIDAKGRQLALAPRHEEGAIVLDVPASWIDQAAYPVVVDPWLDLHNSSVGGGITNSQEVSDRPSVALTGSGNPFLCWSDNTTGTYNVYVTNWNGFKFVDLGGASFGGGLSNNGGRGDSVNPNITVDSKGLPYVCWEDNSEGRVGIYFKRWNGTSAAWEELDNSASKGGLSTTFTGPALHPRVAVINSFKNDPTNPIFEETALLVWEEASDVQAFWHYSGDGQPTAGKPGWYNLGPVSTVNALGGLAGSPSVAVDSLDRPVIAWHDTSSLNYEIYVRRLQNSVAANANAPLALIGYPAFTTGTFTDGPIFPTFAEIAGSGSGGGVSQSPAQLSQYPSVATNNLSISVAWEETLPAGATGTNNEIFAATSDGTAAFTSLGNVSNSPGDSVNPSLDACTIGGVSRLAVAWTENAAPTLTNPTPVPQIYVRGYTVGTTPVGAWEQIGVQGSAAPQLPADTVLAEAGISLTPNMSLNPVLKVDRFGDPTVIWATGAITGHMDVYLKSFSPNGPGNMVAGAGGNLLFVTNLRQTPDDPNLVPATVDLPVGANTTLTTLYFSANLFTEVLNPPGTSLRLQVELSDASGNFTGTAPNLGESLSGVPGSLAVVQFPGLINRNYKWQARTIDQFGRSSPWFQFPTVGGASFQVNSSATTSGAANIAPLSNTTKSRGSCGLLGLEALLALGLIRTLRRRAR
jgi:hypothetical protein